MSHRMLSKPNTVEALNVIVRDNVSMECYTLKENYNDFERGGVRGYTLHT